MRGTTTPLRQGPFSLTIPDTAGVLSLPAAAGGGLANDLLDWLVNVDVFMTPVDNVGFTGIFANTASVYNGYVIGGASQNDYTAFDVVVAAGTWTIELLYVAYNTAGIYTVQVNGSAVGTIDAYAAGTAYNQRNRITGVSIGTSGVVRLKLLMATKNASSGGYAASLSHIQLQRTA